MGAAVRVHVNRVAIKQNLPVGFHGKAGAVDRVSIEKIRLAFGSVGKWEAWQAMMFTDVCQNTDSDICPSRHIGRCPIRELEKDRFSSRTK